ncbi:MAG: hypothetical protein KIH65_005375 [Candidatus Uhrbacteria bacterium]|nr:hypothetical protein [Candidatus Uhrbacteria bacterium]
MHILIFCYHGKNRSRYLAEHLVSLGYSDVAFAGVNDSDHEKIQKEIDKAHVVITVRQNVRDHLHQHYCVDGKRLIELQVDDRPESLFPERGPLSGEAWRAFQREYVYPVLREQMETYLPLE